LHNKNSELNSEHQQHQMQLVNRH